MKQFLKILYFAFIYSSKLFAQTSPAHTVIVILENKRYDSLSGNPAAPYINSLLNNSYTAVLTQSYGLTHPSQPNYLMLFSGSSQGVINNNIPTHLPFTTPNLGAELLNKGYSFIGYSENLPYPGATDSASGGYARKHNAWINWQGSPSNGIPSNSNRAFTDFPPNYNNLPVLSFVIPNVYNDMHDGSISVGDTWLRNNLDGYIQWSINNNSLFILTFDEDNSLSNNHILTFFTGANIKGGSYSQPVTHYNVLRTIEELYQIPFAGASTDSSAILGIWQTTTPVTYTFIGNGNWDIASNWSNNLIPPNTLSAGNEIIIKTQAGGSCILNVPYTVSHAAKLIVTTDKKFVIQGNLTLK